MADALTVVRSKGLWWRFHQEEAVSVLDAWRRRAEIRKLNLTPSIQLDGPSGPEQITKIFYLYRVLHFFLEDYAKTVPRPEWIQATQWNLPLQLSDTEKRRFLRGLCRLYIYCNIFGTVEKNVGYDLEEEEKNEWFVDLIDNDELPDDYDLFYDTMHPWECEELGCVWSYLMAKYKFLSTKICTDLRNLASACGCDWLCEITPEEERPPAGVADVEDLWDLGVFDRELESFILLGPEFLYRVLNNTDYLLQRNLVLINKPPYYPDLGRFIPYDAGFWNSVLYTRKSENQFNIPDFEQHWSMLPPFEQPNIGWKMACLVPHTPQQRLWDSFNRARKVGQGWEWGYAIWDEERLEGWRGDWVNFLLNSPELTIERPDLFELYRGHDDRRI